MIGLTLFTPKSMLINLVECFNQFHQSTYSFEFQKLSEAKLKISTLCDVPQAYTSLTAKFEEVLPNRGNKVAKIMSN